MSPPLDAGASGKANPVPASTWPSGPCGPAAGGSGKASPIVSQGASGKASLRRPLGLLGKPSEGGREDFWEGQPWRGELWEGPWMSGSPGPLGTPKEGAEPPVPVYHERQRLELCAVHALNNVLQQQLFSQEAADEICKRLAPDSRLNPHRSLLGTGNYDVNVIMAALQGLGLAAVWWDRRRPLAQLALPQVLGFILNLPSPVSLGLLSLPLQRRHWVALRQVGGIYYNLDSKLREPMALGGEAELRDFLSAALAKGPCEVLLVVTKEVEAAGSWLQAT
ncbi:josephin-2-like isoform X4 [Notamacropus eugenii]|uniref:josephin-2-like isoform X4 n=1 Tax=Notamacropus eugenii TaxID=9315 RepID=UPI003B66CE89